MSNVTQLSAVRQSPAGHAAHPEPVNPIAMLIAVIDAALGPNWSFDLVHHEVVEGETIVFAKLVVDGRHRIGIGGTTETGSLVTRLNAATVDALTRAAEWMGLAVPTESRHLSPAPVESPAVEPGARITRKQLDYAYSLARDRGIPRDRLAARCLADYRKKPEYLTRGEASALIESLKEVA